MQPNNPFSILREMLDQQERVVEEVCDARGADSEMRKIVRVEVFRKFVKEVMRQLPV